MESPASKSKGPDSGQVAANEAIPKVRSKRRKLLGFRFSTSSLLLLVTLACVAFSVIALNSESVMYGHLSGQYSTVFNVDLDMDVGKLVDRLNSAQLLEEMKGDNPDHFRVLSSWKNDRHGFSIATEVKGSASKSFELQIDIPIYCVRSRRFKWESLWEDSFFTDGPEGKEARVGELNQNLYLVFLEKVTQELANQSGQSKN